MSHSPIDNLRQRQVRRQPVRRMCECVRRCCDDVRRWCGDARCYMCADDYGDHILDIIFIVYLLYLLLPSLNANENISAINNENFLHLCHGPLCDRSSAFEALNRDTSGTLPLACMAGRHHQQEWSRADFSRLAKCQ